jgi:glycosyltransferase involved in cell wall biosynthesis
VSAPRVTIGIPTYERDTYLAEAIASSLAQDYADLEVLVVLDGSSNPRIEEVVASFDDPRLRTVRHDENRGIAAGLNTIFREMRGELMALLGDDDVCAPDRIRRQVEVFDRFPDTGVVHGDAVVIDGNGRRTGEWRSRDFSRQALVQQLFRHHNWLVDSSTMRHRKVFDAIGPCDESLPWEDFSFHVRAARLFRYRHTGGDPLVLYRRHGGNASDESARSREVELVERVLEDALELYDLEDLVPELDWAVLDRRAGERRALEILAAAFEKRQLPLPGLAARTRARAAAVPVPAAQPKRDRGRLMMTSYGFNDAGGGTIVPRLAAKELARRGWDVTVFHAAVKPTPGRAPYETLEWEEDGVRLIGVHNRPHGLMDLGNPWREVDDPAITAEFAKALDRVRPDVVHFHNLHNLGAALLDEAASRGVPSYFSTHNYWLLCPRLYLLTGQGAVCAGPRGGADCASCVGCSDVGGHEQRLREVRARFSRSVDVCMAVSHAVRDTLVAQGYPAEAIDVVRQGLPAAEQVWERLGRERAPGRRDAGRLVLGFFGSAYWHKGPQLLVEAAQEVDADVRVEIHGEIPDQLAAQLRALDRRGVVELGGHFRPGDLPALLGGVDAAVMPSMWWDCAPLMADECLAGRVPLIAPRMGGLTEAVRDGVDGLLFDGLSAGDLASKIERLANEPGLLESLQEAIEAPRPFAEYVDELERYYGGARPSRASQETERPAAVRWIGDHGLATSLSIVNQRACEQLDARADIAVERVERDSRRDGSPIPHAAAVEVRHQWPPDLRPASSGRLAVIQPWEFGAVPRDWIERMRANADEVWVPSELVRQMYIGSGMPAERVRVVPNGVDLERFRPDGPRHDLGLPDGATKLLFVGGVIPRKGPDVLLDAYARGFAGRDDVVLVIKDFGAGSVYRAGDRSAIREWVESGRLPRLVHVEDELSGDEMAALYRACDVLVHPYRGEGFGMPVLEAMACGLPVVVTGGGPTDEFCPDEACWRIRSRVAHFPEDRVGEWETAGRPWMLEPDADHLVELLGAAVTDAGERRRRGEAGATAARSLSWEAVGGLYTECVRELAARPPILGSPAHEALELEEDVNLRVFAAPAWRSEDDRIGELLAAWARGVPAGTSACLYLVADSAVDGSEEELVEQAMAAAGRAGADLDSAADVTVLVVGAVDDPRLHEAMDAYVDLHPGNPGHARAGLPALEPSAESLRAWVAQAAAAAPAGRS